MVTGLIQQSLFELEFLGNSATQWGWALGVWVILYLGLSAALRIFRNRFEALDAKKSSFFVDVILAVLRSTKKLTVLIVALWGGLQFLETGSADRGFDIALFVIITLQAAIWVNHMVTAYIAFITETRKETDPGSVSAIQGLSFVVRLLVWSVAILLIVDNLGYNVTTLVAGLGIGGVAIALAIQNILGDLFGSLSIVLDKPFVVGDFVIVGELMGVVEHIGIKTTRVRSLSGEQLIFSNSDMLNSRIRNFKRMYERRVPFLFGVVYQTTPEQLEAIPPMIKKIVEGIDKARFDRAHFQGFGESAFNFEVVYYVLSSDFNIFMDIQQAINLGIYRGLQKMGVEFAYPTRTLYVRPERSENPAHAGGALETSAPLAKESSTPES